MKKLSLILALALILSLTVGIAVAMAAPYPDDADTSAVVPDDDILDSGEGEEPSAPADYDGTNANHTNVGIDGTTGTDTRGDFDLKRADENLYVHGQFKKNTNACASCHMTHTAAGASLLVQNGVYNTCTACHDGTLGKLDVFDMPNDTFSQGKMLGWNDVGGGTFGGNFDTENASMHMPTGALQVAAAPGGNRQNQGTDLYGNVIDTTELGGWVAEFTCASCHQPHGSYSDRLLQPNPANIARWGMEKARWVNKDDLGNATPAILDENGNSIPGTAGTWQAWIDDDTTDGLDFTEVDGDGTTVDQRFEGPWVRDEAYGVGELQTVVYEESVSDEVYLDGHGYESVHGHDAATGLLPEDLQEDGFAINYAYGYGVAEGADEALDYEIAVVPAVVTKVKSGTFINDGDIATHFSNTGEANASFEMSAVGEYIQGLDGAIKEWSGADEAPNLNTVASITWFCAGCHTDYYADAFGSDEYVDGDKAGSDLEGRYTTAYRHTVNRGPVNRSGEQQFVWESGSLTCLSCHYAHGTSSEIMRNADDSVLAAGETDVNPSSAIKRYVNMGVCYKCHVSTHNAEFLNDPYYYNGGDAEDIGEHNGIQVVPSTD